MIVSQNVSPTSYDVYFLIGKNSEFCKLSKQIDESIPHKKSLRFKKGKGNGANGGNGDAALNGENGGNGANGGNGSGMDRR